MNKLLWEGREWGMGNGEWGMGNGEWGMGNGEWGMGNGEVGSFSFSHWEKVARSDG